MGELKGTTLVALAAGLLIGLNWPKIKKHAGPAVSAVKAKTAEIYEGASRFVSEQKERIEDKLAEHEVKKGHATKKSALAGNDVDLPKPTGAGPTEFA